MMRPFPTLNIDRATVKFFCIIAMAAVRPSFAQDAGRVGFIVLPFRNESSFRGKWEIGSDVPRFISAYLKERYHVPTVSSYIALNYLAEKNLPLESLNDQNFWKSLQERFRLRYVVTGTILDFDVIRFNAGEPLVGGYEAFKGLVSIEFRMYDMATMQGNMPKTLTRAETMGEFSDRSFAFTLFGKPTDRTVEFRDLDKIKFASEEFNRTVIGQACLQLSENVCAELENVLPILKRLAQDPANADSLAAAVEGDTLSFHYRVVLGNVIFVEGDRAFVNLGAEDGLKKGALLVVYSQDVVTIDKNAKEVGTVEILEVRGPHLSLTRIKSGTGLVKDRDRVRVKILE